MQVDIEKRRQDADTWLDGSPVMNITNRSDKDLLLIAEIVATNRNKDARWAAFFNTDIPNQLKMSKSIFLSSVEPRVRHYLKIVNNENLEPVLIRWAIGLGKPDYTDIEGLDSSIESYVRERKLSRRSNFARNVALGIAALIAVVFLMPDGEDKPAVATKVNSYSPATSVASASSGKAKSSAEILKQFSNTKFFKENNMVLDRQYPLAKGGTNNSYDSRDRQFVYVELTTKNGAVSDIGMEVLYPSDTSRPTELIKLFAPEADTRKIKEYLEKNIGVSRGHISEAPGLSVTGGVLRAANISWSVGSQRVNDYTLSFDLNKPVTSIASPLELKRDSEEYKLVARLLEREVLDSISRDPVRAALNAKFPYLKNVDRTQSYTPVDDQEIFLFYEGFPDIRFWSKPGAVSFGGQQVGLISARTPKSARVIAHAQLPGDRNYFYVYLDEDTQGWVGRPYVKRDREGQTFYMANPITGEAFYTPDQINVAEARLLARSSPSRFVPSYDSISWDSRIPERFRRQGYDMYVNALQQGYAEAERIASSYSSYTF